MKPKYTHSFLVALLALILIFFVITCSDESTNNDEKSICEKGGAQYLGNDGMIVTIGDKQCTATIAEAGNGPDFFLFYFAGLIDTNYFQIVTQTDKAVGSYELGGPDNASASLTFSHGKYAYYYTFDNEVTGCIKVTEITGEENVKGAFFFSADNGMDTIAVTDGSFSIPIVD